MLNTGLESALSAMNQSMSYEDEAIESSSSFDTWDLTLRNLFPTTFTYDFSVAQINYWDWVWEIKPDIRPRPYVLILPRGGGKTTNCEVTPILLGAKKVRRYCWYIQETQAQSDKRIANIAEKLESIYVANHYPDMSKRWIGKFGNVGGWRRSFVRTASNVVFEAIGLDKAARSSKIGDIRPDIVIVDDVDSKFDTPYITQKKLDLLTHTLLPAAAENAVIIFSQNLVHYNSIASKLAKSDNTEFLQDRIISGPYPALYDFATMRMYDPEIEREKDVIVSGTPLWEGQNVEACQNLINTHGLSSFKAECQHDVENVSGSLWANFPFQHCTYEDVPKIEIGCVWCDPAVTDKDTSACYAIQADGLGVDGKIYRLMSYEERGSPLPTITTAILWAVELGFNYVGVETDQGGDTWKVVYDTAWEKLIENKDHPEIGDTTLKPIFKEDKAGAGYGSKAHRNNLMLAGYEKGNVIHVVGYHNLLESSLYRFLKIKPYDLTDVAFWSWDFLSNKRWNDKVADAR